MEFFDIKDPQISSRMIAENELAFAFPTNIPIVPGHTLICPKRHISLIEELSEEELRAILSLKAELRLAMIKAFDAQGFNYAWNEGKVAGQSVNHLHIHMLPRKNGDTGIYEYEPRKFIYRPGERAVSPDQELIEVAKLIKDNL